MRILVIAATQSELMPFMQNNPDAETLITGVGAATTVYHLSKQLSRKKYDLVLQVGVAGVYDELFALGDVVVVAVDRFADLGANEKGQFNHVASFDLLNDNTFPYQNGWLVNPHLQLFQHLSESVHANTVNLISDNVHHVQSIKGDAVIETMEGAALHYVCLMESIPFLQIRGVSNEVGERDKSKWRMKEAIDHSCAIASSIYQQQSVQS